MKTTLICTALSLTGSCLVPASAMAQEVKSKPVIVGITLDGKKVLIELNGKKVHATADGVELPAAQIDKKGNRIVVKDRDGHVVARIDRLLNGGTIQRVARSNRATIGIELNRLGKGLADHLDLDPADVIYVTRVIKGRAAAKAGLRDHDVILEIDGKSPANEAVLKVVLGKKKPGDDLEVRVMRRGKESNFVIRCERAETGVASGLLDGSLAPYFLSDSDHLYSKNSFKKAFAALDRVDFTGENKNMKHLQKQLDVARQSLRNAQKAVSSNRANPFSFLYSGLDSRLLLRAKSQVRSIDPRLTKNLLLVNRARSPFPTNAKSAKSSDLGKKIEKLEKRFDRFERMLRKLIGKKSNI